MADDTLFLLVLFTAGVLLTLAAQFIYEAVSDWFDDWFDD